MKKKIILFDHNSKFNYILEEIIKLDVEVFCINNPTNIQLNKYVTVFYVDYLNQPIDALNEIEKIHEKYNFNGILCFAEYALSFVSKLSGSLGLRFISSKAIENTRNKSLLKECFFINGVKTSKYIVVNSEKEIREEKLKNLCYPLVIKPSRGMGSMGVIRANNYGELINAAKIVNEFNEKRLNNLIENDRVDRGKIVIEEYIDGKEYAVETFSLNGQVLILSIGYKGYPVGPYFEESIYIAKSQLESEILQKIEHTVTTAVIAANIIDGPAHVELRVNQDGEPYILEIGARIGGSGVSHFIVKETTGINFVDVCLKLALGQKIDINNDFKIVKEKYACNYIVQIGEGGNLKELEGIDEIRQHNDTYEIFLMDCIGKDYYPYPKGAFFNGYPGFIFSIHDTYNQAVEYVDYLDKTLKLKFN